MFRFEWISRDRDATRLRPGSITARCLALPCGLPTLLALRLANSRRDKRRYLRYFRYSTSDRAQQVQQIQQVQRAQGSASFPMLISMFLAFCLLRPVAPCTLHLGLGPWVEMGRGDPLWIVDCGLGDVGCGGVCLRGKELTASAAEYVGACLTRARHRLEFHLPPQFSVSSFSSPPQLCFSFSRFSLHLHPRRSFIKGCPDPLRSRLAITLFFWYHPTVLLDSHTSRKRAAGHSFFHSLKDFLFSLTSFEPF